MSVKHRQAPITEDGEVVFSVDKKLQSLIQFYWDIGIQTFNSCQDNVEGTCWIEYELNDWLFMSEVSFKSESQALYRFIEEYCEVLLLSCDDGQIDENDEYWIEGKDLVWSASVRFQKSLLPKFEEIIRATFSDMVFEDSDTGINDLEESTDVT